MRYSKCQLRKFLNTRLETPISEVIFLIYINQNHVLWTMDHGQRTMDKGPWTKDHGQRKKEKGKKTMDYGLWTTD